MVIRLFLLSFQLPARHTAAKNKLKKEFCISCRLVLKIGQFFMFSDKSSAAPKESEKLITNTILGFGIWGLDFWGLDFGGWIFLGFEFWGLDFGV